MNLIRWMLAFQVRSAADYLAKPNKPMHATCETHARDGRRSAYRSEKLG
jgi:hypothetical protein|nr:hypothetical protein [uncultured Steroidobacter sp.]